MSVQNSIFEDFKDHNPYWKARAPSYIERREYLFYTHKRRTPGLFSKASTVFVIFLAGYGLHVLKRSRKEKEKMSMVSYEFQRKGLPFLQAIEDRRFLALEMRKNWFLDELFKDNREEFLALKRTYNDPAMWLEPHDRTSIYMNGIPKNYKGPLRGNLNFLAGNDSYQKNVPDAHF